MRQKPCGVISPMRQKPCGVEMSFEPGSDIKSGKLSQTVTARPGQIKNNDISTTSKLSQVKLSQRVCDSLKTTEYQPLPNWQTVPYIGYWAVPVTVAGPSLPLLSTKRQKGCGVRRAVASERKFTAGAIRPGHQKKGSSAATGDPNADYLGKRENQMKNTTGPIPLRQEPPRSTTIPATAGPDVVNAIVRLMEEYELSFKKAARVYELMMQRDALRHSIYQGDRYDEMSAALAERVDSAVDELSTISEALNRIELALAERVTHS